MCDAVISLVPGVPPPAAGYDAAGPEPSLQGSHPPVQRPRRDLCVSMWPFDPGLLFLTRKFSPLPNGPPAAGAGTGGGFQAGGAQPISQADRSCLIGEARTRAMRLIIMRSSPRAQGASVSYCDSAFALRSRPCVCAAPPVSKVPGRTVRDTKGVTVLCPLSKGAGRGPS